MKNTDVVIYYDSRKEKVVTKTPAPASKKRKRSRRVASAYADKVCEEVDRLEDAFADDDYEDIKREFSYLF